MTRLNETGDTRDFAEKSERLPTASQLPKRLASSNARGMLPSRTGVGLIATFPPNPPVADLPLGVPLTG